jgi:pyroglutamyl-peptidase
MSRILLTGFEPFGGDQINPSWEIAKAMNGQKIAGVSIVARMLPCAFGEALKVLQQSIAQVNPDLVLALGQAGGRSDFSIERIAINIDDARIADNAGARPIDLPVVDGAPAAYFSTLPIKTMVAGLRAAGHPASVSQTAGTFVCNHVFFGLQHALHGSGVRSGFMHLPLLPAQAAKLAGQPSMALDQMLAGVRLALELAWPMVADRRESAGTIS